jgi:succinate dehydrogenase / fumarate reductase, membrane anchor subunit
MSLGKSATPVGKVRGIGSAREGGEHWLHERIVSAALVLLSVWLLASLLMLPSMDRQSLVQWLRAPTGAVPMALFVILNFKHAIDGMKVVVDDYVHEEANNFALNTFIKFAGVGGAALALFALARIAFGAQA